MKRWEEWFQPHILERGRAYFDEGRVGELERAEDGYTAMVEGTESYEVEILADGDSIKEMSCSCPYAEDGDCCKHMAAVLFAISSGKEIAKIPAAKKTHRNPAALVASIPEEQLRPLLIQLVSADQKLYSDLLLRYGEADLDECVKTFRRMLAAIKKQYRGRGGYIDYHAARPFSEEFAELIRQQTAALLGRNEPVLAFRMGMKVLREYAGYDMDSSNGDYVLVTEEMDDLCTRVLTAANDETASKIFAVLVDCVKSDQADWLAQDFAKEKLFSCFHGKKFDRKKLELVDEQIAVLEKTEKNHYSSSEYEMHRLLTERFELMQKLSLPEEELDAFLKQHIKYFNIRKLSVQRMLDAGRTADAIRLLTEGKSVDQDKLGLVSNYSEWLMDIYEREKWQDKLLAELEYHIFALRSGGLEMLNRLKRTCTPEQWARYRERYLSGRGYQKLELMESEGLWDRLMKAVAASSSLSTLDRYESSLKERYPNEMLAAYVRVLAEQAESASNRKRYQELIGYLKKLREYPSGAEQADCLAACWRVRYSRRRAMMEELKNTGF